MIDMQHRIRIAVDVTFLLDQYSNRGIGRYGKEIVGKLIQQAQMDDPVVPEVHLLGFGDLNQNLEQLGILTDIELKNLEFHSLGPAQLSAPLANLKLYFGQIRPLVTKLKLDLYFAVHFDRGLPSDLVKTVVTIHDAIPLATGKFSSQGPFMNFMKGLFYKFMWRKVRQAELVITSSNFSKGDLVTHGKIPEGKIQVIYLGIADYFRRKNITTDQKLIDRVLGQFDLLDVKSDTLPYMLYDSGLEANKNIPALLTIFSKLALRQPELKLVMIGGDWQRRGKNFAPMNGRSQQIMDLAAELNIADRIVPTGRVSEQELVILLSEAKQYINLSGYEGFGFGPLQAMAAGVPVIISNRGSFPEVAGPGLSTDRTAAIIVDPAEVDKAAAHIIEALSNEEAIQDMILQGFTQAAKYNWDNTFNLTWQAIVNLWTTHTQN